MAANDRVNSSPVNKGSVALLAGTGLVLTLFGSFILFKDVSAGITVGQKFTRNIEYAVSDTNPVKAGERLAVAAEFMKDNSLDTGDSCVFVYSPACDRSEYYRKLTEASSTLLALKDADELTKSNTMIRVRESFVTYGEKGSEDINHPTLRFAYAWGSNTLGFWLEWVMFVCLVVGLFLLWVTLNVLAGIAV